MGNSEDYIEGGCNCGYVRYRMQATPLIVHCCHCSWCQRQNGSAFAVNALIEAERVELLQGEVRKNIIESPSGTGQQFSRCTKCDVAVWSEYLTMTNSVQDIIYFMRVGTLDDPSRLPPDVHIYTSTKQPWFKLPEGAKAVPEYYITEETWSPESLERRKAIRARIKAAQG